MTHNPQVGDIVLARDSSGHHHRVIVTKAPWRGHSMAMITIRFTHLVGDDRETPWPLDATRPITEDNPPYGAWPCEPSDSRPLSGQDIHPSEPTTPVNQHNE